MKKPIALVTGSTKGIGKAIAEKFEEKNFIVIRNGKSKQNINNYIQADLSKSKDVDKIIKYVEKKFLYLNVLVNNAGFTKYIEYKDTKKLTQDLIDKIFKVNLFAPYHLSVNLKHLLKQSKKFNSINPNIINIASIAGVSGFGSNIAYSASKAGLITMTKSLSSALKPIRVNAISPGLIETNFVKFPKEYYVEMKKKTPVGLVGQPKDVAKLAYNLIENKYITGQNFIIDGGSSL